MKIVVFGLSISSSWGNGHATLLRGLFRALHAEGHEVHFFERDVPYYASHRDSSSFPYVMLHLYADWLSVVDSARQHLQSADAAIITSYCPDARPASDLILDMQPPRTVFYDMDTPVTLSRLASGEDVTYVPSAGLAAFDLVLSYTGGTVLDTLRQQLGARRVAPLYGWVDADLYYAVPSVAEFAADLSYLGTYSADRQKALEELFLRPAALRPQERFLVGGAMHPNCAEWPSNIRYLEHVAPPAHREFYSSSPLTLNVTRASMAQQGFCPSGRLFEASACGAAILSDCWEGLDTFFEPGREILLARSTDDALQALQLNEGELRRIGERARQRTLDCHTAAMRARRLLSLLEDPPDMENEQQLEASLEEVI